MEIRLTKVLAIMKMHGKKPLSPLCSMFYFVFISLLSQKSFQAL